MSNKFLSRARNNAPVAASKMLSNDEAAKLIGHNMGDEFDNLGTDVKNYEDALEKAKAFKAEAARLKGEATTAKLKALIAAAQMAHVLGLTADSKDEKWIGLVKSFANAETAGSFTKESSTLKGALTLQSKRLLVPALRHAEQMHLAAKTGGLNVRAVENVFTSVASYVRNNDGKMPTLDDVKDKIVQGESSKTKAKTTAQAGQAEQTAQPEKAELDVDTVGERFIDNFVSVAANMKPDDAEATLLGIVEAAKEKLAALRAEKEAAQKAAEAATAKDVGGTGKGRKARRQAQA